MRHQRVRAGGAAHVRGGTVERSTVAVDTANRVAVFPVVAADVAANTQRQITRPDARSMALGALPLGLVAVAVALMASADGRPAGPEAVVGGVAPAARGARCHRV